MKLLEKILVPVNFETRYNPQLELAVKVAQRFNSELILLHVLPEEAKFGTVKDIVLKAVNAEFEKLTKRVEEDGVLAVTEYRFGNTFDQIITASEDHNVNVIIIGNEMKLDKNGFGIGVLPEKLTRKAQKPVWVHRTDASTEPKNILCPVDFSESSRRALNNAFKIARIFSSKLYILNVYEPLGNLYSPRLNVDPKDVDAELEKENKETYQKFVEEINFTGVDYEMVQLKGKAYEIISEFISKKSIDLMLIGATGKTMLSRILLGSLTERIARDLRCSLITTKAENILNLKIDSDISNIEKHFENAKTLEKNGFFVEAAAQLKICLQINDLHVPSLTGLIHLYEKMGENEKSKNYSLKLDEILRRLWDKRIEFEIRRHYKIGKI